MATTINERIIEIVEWTEREEQDPVRAVQDYLLEKDSRITRAEAKRLVGQSMARQGLGKLNPADWSRRPGRRPVMGIAGLIVEHGETCTTPLFWACKCEEEYLHPASQEICFACNTRRENAPEADVDQVLLFAYAFHLPIELVRVVESAVQLVKPELAELSGIPF